MRNFSILLMLLKISNTVVLFWILFTAQFLNELLLIHRANSFTIHQPQFAVCCGVFGTTQPFKYSTKTEHQVKERSTPTTITTTAKTITHNEINPSCIFFCSSFAFHPLSPPIFCPQKFVLCKNRHLSCIGSLFFFFAQFKAKKKLIDNK